MTKTQVEVITSVQRRRRWSRAEKERWSRERLLPRWLEELSPNLGDGGDQAAAA
jgi:hypothetical protein